MAEPDLNPSARPGLPPAANSQLADFWSEPVRGGHPDPRLLRLPGIEQLRRQMAGESPEPPLSRLTGLRLDAIAAGEARFSMPLTGWLTGADGQISPGPLSIPADAAMACAIMSQLPAGTPFTTSEMTLRVLRPVSAGGEVSAIGRVISVGPPVALAEVALHDHSGALIAHGSSLCMTLPRIAPGPAGDPDPGTPRETTPDPWQRPAPETARASAPGTGLDHLQARIAGEGDPTPLERFTGLAPRSAGQGEAEYELAASPWFCAPPPGRLQGGVTITLVEAAMFAAIRTVVPDHQPVHPVELKINLLRPLASDGRAATACGRLVHAGRRVAVARGEVSDADGRAIAVATGSALLGEAVAGPR
ncbi:MAG: hypothetical protein QOF83_614 [Solirubrobacteraceae bacterium]|nr:hypothetical protein [Solirubrobacteraceae bacterium]